MSVSEFWNDAKERVRNIFAAPEPIGSYTELVEFVDTRSAFIVQRTTFEYARAKAGTHWDKLMQEEPFVVAVDRCRWEGFATCVGDLVTLLAPRLDGWGEGNLVQLAQDVFAHHDLPEWREEPWDADVEEMRVGLSHRLGQPVHEVMRRTSSTILKTMPVHQRLRIDDDDVLHAAIAFNAVRCVEEFDKRSVPEALARETAAS